MLVGLIAVLLKQMGVVLLAIYGAYGIVTGSIYARDGASARTLSKTEEPFQFWLVCACYSVVGGLIYFAVGQRFG